MGLAKQSRVPSSCNINDNGCNFRGSLVVLVIGNLFQHLLLLLPPRKLSCNFPNQMGQNVGTTSIGHMGPDYCPFGTKHNYKHNFASKQNQNIVSNFSIQRKPCMLLRNLAFAFWVRHCCKFCLLPIKPPAATFRYYGKTLLMTFIFL